MKTRLLLSGGILVASLGLAASASAQTISSAANQTFVVADRSTAMSPLTITTTSGGQIKANTDIRVRIPAGLNMTWDPTITTATITGSAAIKVSTIVSYANGNLDLFINVITNFGNGDQITISGLNFTNFTAPSAASRLGLITGGAGGAVVATDARTKTIVAKVYAVSVRPNATARRASNISAHPPHHRQQQRHERRGRGPPAPSGTHQAPDHYEPAPASGIRDCPLLQPRRPHMDECADDRRVRRAGRIRPL